MGSSKSINRSGILVWMLFILMPLLSYILALKSFKNKWAKNIVWGFAAYFGYAMQITNNFTGDASAYKERFLSYHAAHTSLKDLFDTFFVNSNHIEVVSDFISVIVSKYTSDYHYLFLSYGIFFGYFFSRNIDYIHKKNDGLQRTGSLIITIALSFVVPIWNINGFDFWTASQVFVYGILPLIYEGSPKRLFFILLTPLIHFSYYLIILLSVSFLFVKKFSKSVVIFFLFSFLIVGISPNQFVDIASNYLPSFIFSRASMYLNASSKASTGGNIIFVADLAYKLILSAVFYLCYQQNQEFIKGQKYLHRFFIYTFFLSGLFNILNVIPSVGRFISVTQIFMWMCLFFLLNNRDFRNSKQISLYIGRIKFFLLIFWSLQIMRYLFPILGIGSILSGPLWINNFVNDDVVIGNFFDFLSN